MASSSYPTEKQCQNCGNLKKSSLLNILTSKYISDDIELNNRVVNLINNKYYGELDFFLDMFMKKMLDELNNFDINLPPISSHSLESSIHLETVENIKIDHQDSSKFRPQLQLLGTNLSQEFFEIREIYEKCPETNSMTDDEVTEKFINDMVDKGELEFPKIPKPNIPTDSHLSYIIHGSVDTFGIGKDSIYLNIDGIEFVKVYLAQNLRVEVDNLPYVFTEQIGPIITLIRKRESFCRTCNKVHPNSDKIKPFLLSLDYEIFYSCGYPPLGTNHSMLGLVGERIERNFPKGLMEWLDSQLYPF